MMKPLHVAVAICLAVGGFFIGQTKSIQLAVVNTDEIIHTMAESLARQNIDSDKAHIKIAKFKKDLHEGLNAFAEKNKVLILASNALFGCASDKTEEFISFYNERASS